MDLIARNDDARSRREKGGQWPPFLFLVAVTGSRSSLPSWGLLVFSAISDGTQS
nr:hypothetical protein [uncultured bacterium]